MVLFFVAWWGFMEVEMISMDAGLQRGYNEESKRMKLPKKERYPRNPISKKRIGGIGGTKKEPIPVEPLSIPVKKKYWPRF